MKREGGGALLWVGAKQGKELVGVLEGARACSQALLLLLLLRSSSLAFVTLCLLSLFEAYLVVSLLPPPLLLLLLLLLPLCGRSQRRFRAGLHRPVPGRQPEQDGP
jgi:hypothetical protein